MHARKWLRVVLGILAGLALLGAMAGYALYRAARHVPEFYVEALRGDPLWLEAAGKEMHLRSAEFASHVEKGGRWQQTFTAEQINGFLAGAGVEGRDPHTPDRPADVLPPSLKDPRVAITPEGLWLACRYAGGNWGDTVLSAQVAACVTDENEIALRILKLRAGAVPLPLGAISKEISHALRQLPWRARLAEQGGDPVLLLSIPPLGKRHNVFVQVDTIRLGDGTIEIAGSSKR